MQVFHLMVKQTIEPIAFEECIQEYFDAEKYLTTDSMVNLFFVYYGSL